MEGNRRAPRRAVAVMVTFSLVLGLATAACKEKELNAAAYVEPAPSPGPDLGIPVFATKKDFERQMMLSADKPDSEEYFASLATLKRLAPNTRLLVRHVGNFSYKQYTPEFAEVEVVDGPDVGKRFFVRSSGIKVGVPAVAVATPVAASSQAKSAGKQDDCRTRLSAMVTACKLRCRGRFSTFDPGPKRDQLVEKCEGDCYGDPALPKCD